MLVSTLLLLGTTNGGGGGGSRFCPHVCLARRIRATMALSPSLHRIISASCNCVSSVPVADSAGSLPHPIDGLPRCWTMCSLLVVSPPSQRCACRPSSPSSCSLLRARGGPRRKPTTTTTVHSSALVGWRQQDVIIFPFPALLFLRSHLLR